MWLRSSSLSSVSCSRRIHALASSSPCRPRRLPLLQRMMVQCFSIFFPLFVHFIFCSRCMKFVFATFDFGLLAVKTLFSCIQCSQGIGSSYSLHSHVCCACHHLSHSLIEHGYVWIELNFSTYSCKPSVNYDVLTEASTLENINFASHIMGSKVPEFIVIL